MEKTWTREQIVNIIYVQLHKVPMIGPMLDAQAVRNLVADHFDKVLKDIEEKGYMKRV